MSVADNIGISQDWLGPIGGAPRSHRGWIELLDLVRLDRTSTAIALPHEAVGRQRQRVGVGPGASGTTCGSC